MFEQRGKLDEVRAGRRRRLALAELRQEAVGRRVGRRERLEAEPRQTGRAARSLLREQALDFERLGRLEQRADLLLGDAHLAAVDELEDRLELGEPDVFEDDDGVLLGGPGSRAHGLVDEQRLEVAGARGQNDPVALDGRAAARQRHVGERLGLQQLVERAQQVAPVLVPAETVQLLRTAAHFQRESPSHCCACLLRNDALGRALLIRALHLCN